MLLDEWLNHEQTPVGIGVDAVCISELCALDKRLHGVFVQRTFTEQERLEAEQSSDTWTRLAGRFAVKEAVFKALAPLTQEKTFDFRIVETLCRPDGSPYILPNSTLQALMRQAKVKRLLVSITNEADFAIAFVMALS